MSRATRSWGSCSRTSASSSASAGTSRQRRPTATRCCCTTHPLELYRHQVIKRADVVLAAYLVGHHFDDDEVRRTFDYYDPLTTGDSTLSACVQSVIASKAGYPKAALEYFLDACAVDLLDMHHNTADGIHIASCGGTWLALVLRRHLARARRRLRWHARLRRRA